MSSMILWISLILFVHHIQGAHYTTKYDNIDYKEVVKNQRLLKNYVECLLDTGVCTPDGLELKENTPDAIETSCSKCSDRQKEGSDYIMHYLIDNKPEYWDKLEEKYDSKKEYKKKYLEEKLKKSAKT